MLRTGCWEDRTAWKLVSASDGEMLHAYGYLAGGTAHQPNHTYALVFRKLSFVLADRLYALGLFVTQSSLVPECFIVHPDTCKTQKDKEELKLARKDCIQSILNAMQRKSSTLNTFPVL